GRLVQQQRQKIMEYYEKKEKQVELQRKIQRSNMQNQGRLQCLKARDEHVKSVLNEARSNLSKISADRNRYPPILKGLILQSLHYLIIKNLKYYYLFLQISHKQFNNSTSFFIFVFRVFFQLLEKQVLIRCRKNDAELVEQLLPECIEELQKAWGDTSQVVIDNDQYLSPENAGGVELLARNGKIRVSSTLESRLDLIADQIVPHIRTALFGPNPNRKFFD
uniref:V-type proton ATPase subunit E n=1 Tax=Meloidogyne incognita TaxID=6306 RepID=A0A914NLM4_MELIC